MQEKKQRPRCVGSKQMALVQIELDRPMCLERYSDYRALGHVVLRDASATVAVGIITSVDASV